MSTTTARISRRWHAVAAFGLVLAFCASALAEPLVWSANATGEADRYGWYSGRSDDDDLGLTEGLWGSPAVSNEKFDFTSVRPEFKAEGSVGLPSNIQSTMDVWIDPSLAMQQPAAATSEVYVKLSGVYTGSPDAFSASSSTLRIFTFENGLWDRTLGSVSYTNASFNETDHTWEASIDIPDVSAVLGVDVGLFNLFVDTHLISDPTSGSASIDVTGGQVILPEPATIALMLMGGVALFARRSRRVM